MSSLLYVVNSLNLGGTENLVVQMSKAFQGEYAVSVICLDEPGIWAQELRRTGIDVHCFWRQPGLDLRLAAKIAGYCRRHKVDLIHAHQSTAWFYSALSRFFFSRPKLLFEEHGRHFPEVYNWKKNGVNKLLIQNLTSAIVAVSRDIRQRLVVFEGVSERRIEVLYNGVATPRPIGGERREELRRSFGFGAADVVVGTMGRLDQIKNLPMLFQAFQAARSSHVELKLLLVGDGPEDNRLRNLASQMGIAGVTVFAGYRRDVEDLVQCMDLFVLCSFSEGTSMALLEAMAACVPAIVTNVGGNPELVLHRQTGWVVPSGSHEELAAAIIEGVEDEGLAQNLAKRGADRFRLAFTFECMIDGYRRLYRSLLEGL